MVPDSNDRRLGADASVYYRMKNVSAGKCGSQVRRQERPANF
jgi:hypothetical protein